MTCKKCERYVTSYKGTWRNLGTLAKQPCKPKARRHKGYEGKAATPGVQGSWTSSWALQESKSYRVAGCDPCPVSEQCGHSTPAGL
eukprot:6197077-Amphidinium_carterae.1